MARLLPDWISGYILHTQHTEAPEHFHFWTAISTVAGALRRRVWIDMKYFRWYPNFFIILVAPPGVVAKSTTVNIGMSMLRQLPYIKFGPAASTWQAFIKFMANCREDFAIPGASKEEALNVAMCAATLEVSELGTFLDPRNREQIDVLTDLWDGRDTKWEKITKGHGDDEVINPWINLIGCTTPSWVADNVSTQFIDGGFATRVVFVYGQKKRKIISYPQLEISDEFMQEKEILIHDLDEIANLVGEFKLTKEAFEWGDEWNKTHVRKMQEGEYTHLPGEKFRWYLSRRQTFLHKMAMVLSASRGDDLTITPQDMIRADKFLFDAECDLPKVFGHMDRETEVTIAADVLDQLRMSGKIQQSELYREHFFRRIGWDTFEKILRSLQAAGVAKITNENGQVLITPVYHDKKEKTNEALRKSG